MSQPYPTEPTRNVPQSFPGASQYHPSVQQPNYSMPTPGGGFVTAPEHPDTTLVLVLGALSWFTAITGPFAWYFGSRARRHMREQPGRWSQSTGLTVGWVLGIINTVLVVAGILLMIVTVVVGVTIAFNS